MKDHLKRAEELSVAIEGLFDRFKKKKKTQPKQQKTVDKHPGVPKTVSYCFLDFSVNGNVDFEEWETPITKSDSEIAAFVNKFAKQSTAIFKKYEKPICKYLDELGEDFGLDKSGTWRKYTDIPADVYEDNQVIDINSTVVRVVQGRRDPSKLHIFVTFKMDTGKGSSELIYLAFTEGKVFWGGFESESMGRPDEDLW